MHKAIIVLAICVGVNALARDPAAADPFKWCAEYTGGMGGANCGFVTLEQCQANVVGAGGFCRPNPFYSDDAERRGKRERRDNPR